MTPILPNQVAIQPPLYFRRVREPSSMTMDDDKVLAALLTAIEDLHNIRNEMHGCIKQGFLNMAKARRSLGWNSVSALDTREEYSAEVTISVATTSDTLKEPACKFSRNRIEPAGSPMVIRNGSLRQRGVSAQMAIEESLLQPHSDAPVRGDSLSLFAALVPPPLRKSKKNFVSAIDYAVEASNLAHRINHLREVLEARESQRDPIRTSSP